MRRVRSSRSRSRFAALVLICAAAAALAWLGLQTRDEDAGALPERIAASPTPATVNPRNAEAPPVYPYSVIPGGARDSAELRNALHDDPIAARHYTGFAVEHAVLEWVHADRRAYVSYRLNGRIYWTAHRVRIARGEYVLTDGVATVRARCGNRISDVPQTPVASAEPPEEAMDWLPPMEEDRIRPVITALDLPPAIVLHAPAPAVTLTEPEPPASITLTSIPAARTEVLVEYRPWIATPTPEPGTWLLFGTGAAALVYRRFRISRQRD